MTKPSQLHLNSNHTVFDLSSLNQLVNLLPYPVILSKTAGDTRENILLNRQFEEEIGYTLKEIPTIDEWFLLAYPDPEYRIELAAKWKNESPRDAGQSICVVNEAQIYTKYNGPIWYEVRATIFGEYEFVFFVNMNALKIKYDTLANQEANSFSTIAVLSHDLRSPLVNLLSLVSMVEKDFISRNEFNEMLNSVKTKAREVVGLLDTTVLWSKNNISKTLVTKRTFDLGQMVRSVLSIYENQCQRKNIQVVNTVGENVLVDSDHDIVMIIIRNLFHNAIKFTLENGRINLSVSQSSPFVYLQIEDTGVGMPDEIMEAFKSGTHTSVPGTSGETGTGMGLRLCQDLALRIGLILEIKSAPGKGTTVNLGIQA